MAYTKQTWATGDVVTAEKLNHMEDGIEANVPIVVTVTNRVASMTSTQIKQAIESGKVVILQVGSTRYYEVDANPNGFPDSVTFFQNALLTANRFTIDKDGNCSTGVLGAGTYSKPSGGIPETDLAQGVKDKLLREDSNRAQYFPVLFDGLGFSTSLTPEQIAEGYTLSKEEGGETITVSCPAFQQSSYTMAYIYSAGYQWYEGVKLMLYPDYSDVDGVTFYSLIADLGDIGLTGYVGVLEISPYYGYTNNYVATLHYWQDASGGDLPYVEVTYSELKTLRDGGNLVAGTKYRITDYVTIINGTYDLSAIGAEGYLHHAVSAGHPFDLIVEAVGAGELSEIAQAALHSGDTYFANADLGGWEVKYCLDNDTSRFSWASSSGKGVIYGLKDEWNNYCGYDFKNIMFPRYALKLADATADFTPTDTGLVYDASTQPNRYGSLYQIYTALQSYMGSGMYENPWVQTNGYENGSRVTANNYDFAVGANILGIVQFPAINETYLTTFAADLYYTFDWFDDGTHYDASLNENVKVPVRENYIALDTDPLYAVFTSNNVLHGLGGNVFENNAIETGSAVARCNSNCIKVGSPFNTFGNCAFGNKLSEICYGNTFGNDCNGNTFGNNGYFNTFGNNCYGNTFGHNGNGNTFGNNDHGNTFGDGCHDNTFGNNGYFITFGDDCYINTFGDGCHINTFGNGCYGNTFGDDCYINTFGINDHGNTFGDGCNCNTFGKECAYINVARSENSGSGQFYHICDNAHGTDISPLSITIAVNRTFETWVGYNSSGVLKTWCPMDAAT